ncbi:Sterol 3-beta-glucosyltransferase [Tulasnella sp. 403]|nr:Sterol 3-beta-glucosyltransferase [Tulasnella sp. 403]
MNSTPIVPSPPPPTVMNPLPGTTIQTSPSRLGLAQSQNLSDGEGSSDKHASTGLLSRTLDKLSRSKSLTSKRVDRKPSSGSSNSRGKRLSMSGISIGKKTKCGGVAGDNEESGAGANVSGGGTPGSENDPTPGNAQSSAPSAASSRPPTPPDIPSRPSLPSLGVDGSMRAGTQTLIQALHAIPWEEDREEELGRNARSVRKHRESAFSSGSDDEDPEGRRDFLASSIHAIHRPVARSRRGTPAVARSRSKLQMPDTREGYFSPASESELLEDDETEDMDEDFQADQELGKVTPGLPIQLPLSTKYDPRAPSPTTPSAFRTHLASEFPSSSAVLTTSPVSMMPPGINLPTPARQGSMASVRLKRKVRLAEKLREVFELKEVEEVVAEMPCWLLRSVLLQGYMYLTSSHLCFFAHMPSREDQVLKSGSLSKKTSRTKRWSKHWYVLKNDVLSWYQSSADPYFPHGNIDLRYAVSCESVAEREFKLVTNQKTLILQADSIPSRDEWVKAIKKVMFKAQNHGESVKISLPFSAMVDVEKSAAMDFSDTIEVKVVDKDDNFAIDSYFFAYFHNIETALVQIKETIQAYRAKLDMESGMMVPPSTVRDTTSAARPTIAQAAPPTESANPAAASQTSVQSAPSAIPASQVHSSGSRFGGLTSLLGLRGNTAPPASSIASHQHEKVGDDFTHVTYAPVTAGSNTALGTAIQTGLRAPSSDSGSRRTITPGQAQAPVDSPTPTPESVRTALPTMHDHTYPPHAEMDDRDTFQHISMHDGEGNPVTSSSSLAGYVPSWLKDRSRRLFGSSGATTGGESYSVVMDDSAQVKEVLETRRPAMAASHSSSVASAGTDSNQLGFSILEAPAQTDADAQIADKFRTYFALDEKEQLLGYFPGYLFRVLPLFGRIYISTNYFCYRSGQPLRKTLMKIPIRDVIATENSKAFRFGHHGLIVVIKGHEELFFEFNSSERRAECIRLLSSQMDELERRNQAGETEAASQSKRDALILEELEPTGFLGESAVYQDGPRPPPETDTLPAVMFTSNSSTFLAFKPQESMRITCLTIGSRGDCQPYIALCKRLQTDGHKCRIATHEEYKDWVEGHGIEHTRVGGDPAELMRICVENGMFTVGFLKEGLQKVSTRLNYLPIPKNSKLTRLASQFRGWLDDLLQTAWTACQDSDLLIESPSAMAGIHIAEAMRIPYFRAFTMPYTRTRAYPHAFAVPERKMGGSYNYMTYVMFDQVFWRAISGQVNRWRRNTLGISSTTFDRMEQHRVPFLYNFSPSVVPPPLDWYEWIRVTGYWFLDDPDDSAAKKWTPPPDLVSFIDSAHALGKKVVYIGFGSIVVSDPEAMTRAVVEAIELSGVYAILSKGWSDRLSTKKHSTQAEVPEIKLPPCIYPIQSIPHDWLFPRIDAACHHGGAGTTGASLRAGIPTIIKPFFGDQFFWGDRVEAMDVGSCVRKLTVDNLTEALRAATTSTKQIEKAKLLGQKIRAEKGVDNAVEAIYRDLEYARTLIKQPSTPEHEPIDAVPGSSTNRVEGTLERSVEGDDSNRGTSEWSVISGEDGEERIRHLHPDRSPSPVHNSKRSSISGALSALSSALPKPSLSKRLSYDSRSSDRH